MDGSGRAIEVIAMTKLELMQALDDLADAIAKMDRSEWATWVCYLLEQLDAHHHGGFGEREASRVWLDKVRAAILGRLRGKSW